MSTTLGTEYIYVYAKFGACFQKCTNIVLSHWTLLPGDDGDGLFYVDVFRAKHCLAFV